MNPIPEYIGKYKNESEIGQGGFAVVYKAKDPSLNRDVAIKVLRSAWARDPKMVKRFRREAQSAAGLRHPNIVTVFEVSELDEGETYIVMEYLPGRSLAEILVEEGVLAPEQTVAILRQVADALDYLHEQNLVHRDVSPKNIMVERKRDGSLNAVLTDFGLVKVLVNQDRITSGPLGTVEYMAPEQIVAERQDEIGPATDVYALGVMAYRMLVGCPPFGGNAACVLVSHLQDAPPDPSILSDSVSPEVAAVLLRSLAKNPAERYLSAGQMVDALCRSMSGAGLWHEPQEAGRQAIALDRPGESGFVEIPQMLYIPDGLFWMGSDDRDLEAAANEKPRHREYLPAYFFGKYPVTNAQYRTFVRATGYPAPAHWLDGRTPTGTENHPVTNVSYRDAYAYCHWLSEVTGEAFHLPTEYQWEKAARGGEPETRRYPWGDGWMRGYCNSAEEGWQDTTAVNRYEWHNCSPHGVIDTVGNVWEWTDGLYRPYPNSTHYSTVYMDTYVVRGGSWKNDRQDARVSVRGRYKPDVRRPYLGFRVARQVSQDGR